MITKLYVIEPGDRSGPILICDQDHNDIAEFFHNEEATVAQSYEDALGFARFFVMFYYIINKEEK
jgi:hypothetical protein